MPGVKRENDKLPYGVANDRAKTAAFDTLRYSGTNACSESVTARFRAGALVFIVEYRSFPKKAFDNALLEKIRLFDVDPMC